MRKAAIIKRLAARLAMIHIRRRVRMKRPARTVFKSARNQAAGTSNSQDPSTLLVDQTRRYLGVRERGKGGVSLEIRWSPGRPKLYAGFFQGKEHAAMAYDVARMCHLGKQAYLKLLETKLNHWEKRGFLADRFCGDHRMEELAVEHRRKEVAGQKWDDAMKASLRELASDALKLIKATAQEEAAAPKQSTALDGRNNNGNLNLSSLSDEGLASMGTLVGASIVAFNLVGELRGDNDRLKAENRDLKAENRDLKAENRDLKAENLRHALNHSDDVFLRNQHFPVGDGSVFSCSVFQSFEEDQATTSHMALGRYFEIAALNSIGGQSE